MPNDPPFDSNNAWWPNPGWPRTGPLGATYPNDWTDPFINPRAIAPAAIAPFSAAQLGAMAWHPPIFPWESFPSTNFPRAAWPPPVPPVASTFNTDLAAPVWPDPQSPYLSPAQSTAPAASSNDWTSPFVSLSPIDNLGGLFSHAPSIPYGLFPYPFDTDPGPTARFASGFLSAGGPATSAPAPATPGAPPTSGWPAAQSSLPPLPPLPNPFAAAGPAPDSSSDLNSGLTNSATTPPRSVLFKQPRPIGILARP